MMYLRIEIQRVHPGGEFDIGKKNPALPAVFGYAGIKYGVPHIAYHHETDEPRMIYRTALEARATDAV